MAPFNCGFDEELQEKLILVAIEGIMIMGKERIVSSDQMLSFLSKSGILGYDKDGKDHKFELAGDLTTSVVKSFKIAIARCISSYNKRKFDSKTYMLQEGPRGGDNSRLTVIENLQQTKNIMFAHFVKDMFNVSLDRLQELVEKQTKDRSKQILFDGLTNALNTVDVASVQLDLDRLTEPELTTDQKLIRFKNAVFNDNETGRIVGPIELLEAVERDDFIHYSHDSNNYLICELSDVLDDREDAKNFVIAFFSCLCSCRDGENFWVLEENPYTNKKSTSSISDNCSLPEMERLSDIIYGLTEYGPTDIERLLTSEAVDSVSWIAPNTLINAWSTAAFGEEIVPTWSNNPDNESVDTHTEEETAEEEESDETGEFEDEIDSSLEQENQTQENQTQVKINSKAYDDKIDLIIQSLKEENAILKQNKHTVEKKYTKLQKNFDTLSYSLDVVLRNLANKSINDNVFNNFDKVTQNKIREYRSQSEVKTPSTASSPPVTTVSSSSSSSASPPTLSSSSSSSSVSTVSTNPLVQEKKKNWLYWAFGKESNIDPKSPVQVALSAPRPGLIQRATDYLYESPAGAIPGMGILMNKLGSGVKPTNTHDDRNVPRVVIKKKKTQRVYQMIRIAQH